jgi:hypothetical protein
VQTIIACVAESASRESIADLYQIHCFESQLALRLSKFEFLFPASDVKHSAFIQISRISTISPGNACPVEPMITIASMEPWEWRIPQTKKSSWNQPAGKYDAVAKRS